jgi:hypothetical protein
MDNRLRRKLSPGVGTRQPARDHGLRSRTRSSAGEEHVSSGGGGGGVVGRREVSTWCAV